MSTPKHILVIRLSAMGDVAMTVPVLAIFRAQYPDVKLTILTRPKFAPLFSSLENTTVFLPDLEGKHKGVFGLWRLSKELNKINFDAIADLHCVLRTTILKLFLPKPFIRLDKGRVEKKALINGNFKPLKSTHQRYADVFEKLGFNLELSKPKFLAKHLLPEQLKNTIQSDESRTKKWIGIAPFAAYASKMYPLDKMQEVISILSKNHKVLLFGGGEKEVSILNTIAENNTNVENLAGKLNFDDELNVISNLDIMLSMDSGNGHLAAMFGVKVITIWGVTHPNAGFKPFNQPDDYQLLADREKYPLIPTSIYGNKFPDGYEKAAGSILPEEIIDRVTSIL